MKEFNTPEIEFVRLAAEDVIATSNTGCETYCDNKGYDDDL